MMQSSSVSGASGPTAVGNFSHRYEANSLFRRRHLDMDGVLIDSTRFTSEMG